MGIVTNLSYAGLPNQMHLTIDGRLQEYSSLKELIRQLPIGIDQDITSNRDWLFQRTLTGTSPSAIYPLNTANQFYCPTVAVTGSSKYPNTVEGANPMDNVNALQPNFIFIASNYPVSVTFGYTPDMSIFRDPSNLAHTLVPIPVFTGTGGPTVAATGVAVVSATGTITGVTITNAGYGYTGSVAVTFTGGGGTSAAGTATIDTYGRITAVTIGTPGSGYNPPPANLNFTFIVNGYFMKDMSKSHLKIAPTTATELANWNPGVTTIPALSEPYPPWSEQSGISDGAITFPIMIEKPSSIDNVNVLIYAALLSYSSTTRVYNQSYTL